MYERYIKESDARLAIMDYIGSVAEFKAARDGAEGAMYAIETAPTADVVPKSEVEELTRENESLAKTVNEASELVRKLRSKVKKSKSEVEELEAELSRYTENLMQMREQDKRNIEREIFEEIENMISPMLGLEDDKEYVAILSKNFSELKKKYPEIENG